MTGHKGQGQGMRLTVFVVQFESQSEAVSSCTTLGKYLPVEPSAPAGLFDQ